MSSIVSDILKLKQQREKIKEREKQNQQLINNKPYKKKPNNYIPPKKQDKNNGKNGKNGIKQKQQQKQIKQLQYEQSSSKSQNKSMLVNKNNQKLEHEEQQPTKQQQIEKSQSSISREPPKNLFKGMKFFFPKFNVQLTQKHAQKVKNTIKQYQGQVCYLQNFKQQPSNDTDQYLAVDFMLVGSGVQRQSIQQQIKDQVAYQDILNFQFIFDCKNKGILLDTKNYIIPYKDQQLEHYIKQKKAETELEKQIGNKYQRKIWNYAPGTGIQPLDKTQYKQSLQFQLKGQCYNKQLAQAFQKLRALHEIYDISRAYLYQRIANMFHKPSTPRIFTQQDADKLLKIRFFGPKTVMKVKQYVRTGTIQKMDIMAGKPQNLARVQLQKIYGIGTKKAHELFNLGINSIEDLRAKVELGAMTLSKNQLIGLKYYEQLIERIPYEKAEKIFQFVKNVLFEIVGSDQLHNIEACGSFRRKKATCGDVDIIISRKDGIFQKDLLSKLVNKLTLLQFLTDHLTNPKIPDSSEISMSFMGICKFQSQKHIRLDIKYYPLLQYPFAILYFTGSQNFNKHMRNHALTAGYTLTDHGMWEVERCGKQLVPRGQSLVCRTEEQIFTIMGLKYKIPEERSV